jgi:FPC/CPF motif-containing protein YcgG
MQMDEVGLLPLEEEPSEVSDWKSRFILGDRVGVTDLPRWATSSYAYLRSRVTHDQYPCFFGTRAEERGEMFYSLVPGKDVAMLPATMAKFAELAKEPIYSKNNVAIFFEPDAVPLPHEKYHDLFWQTLQYLHDNDPDPAADRQPDPTDPLWEFSFAGVQMFVVCGCPSFGARHSRNLGPGMVLLFQPRSVFVDRVTNKVISARARQEVRKRLEKWDSIPAHPDLGTYGDPENREWKQYFLPDENEAAQAECPFSNRSRRRRPSDL